MPGDPYYRTPEWRRLRRLALERDQHTCTVAGCGRPAVVVDHDKARRHGGEDRLRNLRSLCREHDNQIKERRDGSRRSNGQPFVRGCDEHGRPLDPNHAWNRSSPRPARRGGD